MKTYIEVLKKYWVFTGRSSRQEYWIYAFVDAILCAVLYVTVIITNTTVSGFVFVLFVVYVLVTLPPRLGVTVRRLHDSGLRALWIFITLIPYIGQITLLYFLIRKSQNGENTYGQSLTVVQNNQDPLVQENSPTEQQYGNT